MPHSILVVDDEKLIVKSIKFSLEQDGMQVDAAYDGEEALRLAKGKDYDLVILDVMLPKIEGLEVCRQLREFSDVPIIMFSAKDEDIDRLKGFDFGADDYVTKTASILELKAKIKAILRRSVKRVDDGAGGVISVRGLRLDRGLKHVTLNDDEVNLTNKEYDVLELLMANPGRIYSRENLLNLIWGPDYVGKDRTVDVHVRRLREKIEENPSDPQFIHTKWGVGYYFK